MHYLFDVKEGVSEGVARRELSLWLSDLYEVEEANPRRVQIGGYAAMSVPLDKLQHVHLNSCSEGLDWHAQWESFAPGFDKGLAHLNVGSSQMLLGPGAGFGDGSHPTTRLALSWLPSLVKDRVVVDVGCGSGILSIASALLGAKKVYGIDIETAAVEHAQRNGQLNAVEDCVHFASCLDPVCLPEEVVVVMNMIASEQEQAWKALADLHRKKALILTTGILRHDALSYHNWTQEFCQWSCLEERCDQNWICFLFNQQK